MSFFLNQIEFFWHALWGCEIASHVWSQGHRKVQKLSYYNPPFLDIWQLLINKLDALEMAEADITAKLIWH